MERIVILTEAGKYIGFGHVARCIAFYEACQASNISAELVLEADKTVAKFLKGVPFKIVKWFDKPEAVSSLLAGNTAVIIDSHLAGEDFYRRIAKNVQTPVYIDDNKRLDFPRGLVINGNIHAAQLAYPARKGTEYLLGPKFVPLRKAFWEASQRTIHKTPQSVLVTLGGTDSHNLTPRILELLVKEFPQLRKKVIIGEDARNLGEIEGARDARTEIISCATAFAMKKAMYESDIAISGGGQTLYELARSGLAVAVIKVADDQSQHIESWQKTGFIEYVGDWDELELLTRIKSSLRRLSDYGERKKRSKLGFSIVDGKGALRTIRHIVSVGERHVK